MSQRSRTAGTKAIERTLLRALRITTSLGLLWCFASSCTKTGSVLDERGAVGPLEPCPQQLGDNTGLSVDWPPFGPPELFWTGEPAIEVAVSAPGLSLPLSEASYTGRVHWAVSANEASSASGLLPPVRYAHVPKGGTSSTRAVNWLTDEKAAPLFAGECYQFSVVDQSQSRRTITVRAPSDFIPVTDPCVPTDAEAFGGLMVRVDGPQACEADAGVPDTLVRFTGSAFTYQAATCRAMNVYFGTQASEAGRLQDDLPIPQDTTGYCLVNRDTEAEFVMYALCGDPEEARAACASMLEQTEAEAITADWFYCPGPPFCPAMGG